MARHRVLTLLMVSLAPLPFATFGNREQSMMGQNYMRSLFALGFQGFLIMVCVGIYAVLIQSVAFSTDIIASLWKVMGFTILLAFTLFKTGAVAHSIFHEPLFADGSYGYRPNRSAKDAILKVKEYAEQGYTFAVVLDLSKYFDTLNHEILINLLRKNVKDERVVQLIKRYLKSGVMENGVVIDTEEGSPQGGNLSPLLANVYLNEFDQEFLKRGVPCIRYADDIVLLAKSKRASERLLESSTKYLEERLKLTVNREKSRTVSVFAIRNFKFLGFALGRNGKGIYVRVHPKSWKKFKSRLKELSSRKRCQSIKPSLEKIKVYARGWLNYYGIASMKNNIDDINGWLYHRIRMCIWKQWKKPRTKYKNLVKLGIPEHYAATIANSRRKYWYISNNKAVIWALNKERLINSGFYDLATAYQSVHVNY